ncbi:MAG: hypothetical protein ACYTFW_24760, partial [Planctomycetota bacterium]
MTIHFVSNSLEDWFKRVPDNCNAAGPSASLIAVTNDVNYVPRCMEVSSFPGPGGNYILKVFDTALTSGFLHFNAVRDSVASGAEDTYIFDLTDNAGVGGIRFRTVGLDGQLQGYNGSTWVDIGNVPIEWGVGVTYRYDCEFHRDATNGVIRLFMNEVEVASFLGDTTQYIPPAGIERTILWGSKLGTRTYISEVIYADETTVGMRLSQLVVNGEGNS